MCRVNQSCFLYLNQTQNVSQSKCCLSNTRRKKIRIPESLPEDFCSFTGFVFLPSSFFSSLVFLHSVLIGILDGGLFPSLSTEFLDRCFFVAVAAPGDNFPSLLLLSRVVLIGILDFFCPGGRPFLSAPPISLLASCEAIGFRPRISQAKRRLRTKNCRCYCFRACFTLICCFFNTFSLKLTS